MTTSKLIEGRSVGQEPRSGIHRVASCLACEALERDRTGDAQTLLRIARRCLCGCVSLEALTELATHTMVDALTEIAVYRRLGAAGPV